MVSRDVTRNRIERKNRINQNHPEVVLYRFEKSDFLFLTNYLTSLPFYSPYGKLPTSLSPNEKKNRITNYRRKCKHFFQIELGLLTFESIMLFERPISRLRVWVWAGGGRRARWALYSCKRAPAAFWPPSNIWHWLRGDVGRFVGQLLKRFRRWRAIKTGNCSG